jgi:hypothetical protein
MASVTEFASITDVQTITGVIVTDVDRNTAANVIEMLTGLIEEVARTDISDRDRYWLKLATAYQTAFVAATPDFRERLAVSSYSDSGQSMTLMDRDAHILAPLARRAIKRLSWRGPRGINIGAIAGSSNVTDVTSEAYDDSLPWTPM